MDIMQLGVFVSLTLAVAFITYQKCKGFERGNSSKEYFLANGGLSWVYIGGSIVLTNISAEQIVGMNGPQMLLVAWWELAAAFGLIILAHVFIPIYYKTDCLTTSELLEKKTNSKSVRAIVSVLFLLGYVFILLPTILYTGSLFMKTMFGLDLPIIVLSILFAMAGAAYAIFGGLRAIAISDTYNGIGLLIMGTLVTVLGLYAIDFDLTGLPAERMTMIGDQDSYIPFDTVFTGLPLICIFYFCTNMVITQRALAAKNIKEAQKGVYMAIVAKIFMPVIVVLPGLISYKLYGDIGDSAYGTLVGNILPSWLSGAFAAVMAGAVLSSFNSCINSAAALYVCDIHQNYINKGVNVQKIGMLTSLILAISGLIMVPIFQNAESVINMLQQFNGLYSMPVLGVFILAMTMKNINPTAIKFALLMGTVVYAVFTFVWSPLHYIHLMAISFMTTVIIGIVLDKLLTSPRPVVTVNS
ncbi:solute:sodium symporter family transporter [Paraglaciecola sp. L3A3]|uniref:solute:sodium symporter family transporter n=1 Tax=Paraglaciecola sp. L3A3 TaxID=2686358 RepID=UPI00131E607D|nr:solute:sodium symporter family transporter [Paraglaciecola sp. L3A3]